MNKKINTRQTSPGVASNAGRLLAEGKGTAAEKAIWASALSQAKPRPTSTKPIAPKAPTFKRK